MVEITEVDESASGTSSSSKLKNHNSSNINFGTSASQRKRRVPRTEQAKTDYADKVFGRSPKNTKEQTNYRLGVFKDRLFHARSYRILPFLD